MLSTCRQQSEQQRYGEARPCTRMPSISLGPYFQCSEPFHHCVVPSAQHWCQMRCTECTRPRNYLDRLRCNSVPGQSWGPDLKCSEEPCNHHTTESNYLGYSITCTECCKPHMLPCNSVPGQSRGPHVQCTEQPFHHIIPYAQQWCRIRCTECSRPHNYQDRLRCNSVPDRSRGPHLQCSEQHSIHVDTTAYWWNDG